MAKPWPFFWAALILVVFADSGAGDGVFEASHRIDALAKTLAGDESESNKLAVVNVLGELRTAEAAAVLVKHIELGVRPTVMRGEDPFAKTFPVRAALIQIGTAAVPSILDALKNEENAQRFWQLTFALSSIVGKEEALQLLRAIEVDRSVSEGTRELLDDWIKKLSPVASSPR